MAAEWHKHERQLGLIGDKVDNDKRRKKTKMRSFTYLAVEDFFRMMFNRSEANVGRC